MGWQGIPDNTKARKKLEKKPGSHKDDAIP